jgi:hypothetical protein
MKIITSILVLVALQFDFTHGQSSPEICGNYISRIYKDAQNNFPYLKGAISAVGSQSIARWYSDNPSEFLDNNAKAAAMFDNCRNGGRPIVPVYGIPNKDCDANFSNMGDNKGWADYNNFIWALHAGSKSRGVTYIIEPDALALVVTNNCAVKYGYINYMALAISVLGQNPNAELYVDVGYWVLVDDTKAGQVASIIRQIDPNGRVKGISINTSNYRSNSEIGAMCDRFVRVSGRPYKCIIDTSRNYRAPSSREWCNYKDAGTGAFPTRNPGGNIAFYGWIKPPGDSDGECYGRTSDSMVTSIKAGFFFPEHFVNLWNNGLFVQTQGYKRLDAGLIRSVPVFPTVQMRYNTDFIGNDIYSALSPTAEGCIEICRQRFGCFAFSWSNNKGGTCWLKSQNTRSSASSGIHSALVSPGGYMQYDTDYFGNDIGNVKRTNSEACIEACRVRQGCQAFSWSNYNGGTCWLKRVRGNAFYKAGIHSGVIS